MNLMWQTKNNSEIERNVSSVTVDEDTLEIDEGDRTKRVKGNIVSVNNATEVSVSDYFGEEISKIEGEDVTEIESDFFTVLCQSAQQISNRCILEFEDDRTVDITGYIISAED